MIDKNSLIPQFESIVSDIKNTTCEIQEFKNLLRNSLDLEEED